MTEGRDRAVVTPNIGISSTQATPPGSTTAGDALREQILAAGLERAECERVLGDEMVLSVTRIHRVLVTKRPAHLTSRMRVARLLPGRRAVTSAMKGQRSESSMLATIASTSETGSRETRTVARMDWLGNIIQVAAIVAAVGASIVALRIAKKDRATQIEIARKDRELSRLTVELEYAVRLSANRNHGSSTDALERARLGAEALALASVVGARWVPAQFERAMDYKTPEGLQAVFDDPATPQWVKDKIEAGRAVQEILDAMYNEEHPKRS